MYCKYLFVVCDFSFLFLAVLLILVLIFFPLALNNSNSATYEKTKDIHDSGFSNIVKKQKKTKNLLFVICYLFRLLAV